MFGIEKITGKTKREHGALLLTEDARVLELSLPVDIACLTDDMTEQGWALMSDCVFPKKSTDSPFLLISERDIAPIQVNGNGASLRKASDKQCNQLVQEARRQAHFRFEKGKKKDKLADALVLLTLLTFALFGIVVVVGLIGSGKASLPF